MTDNVMRIKNAFNNACLNVFHNQLIMFTDDEINHILNDTGFIYNDDNIKAMTNITVLTDILRTVFKHMNSVKLENDDLVVYKQISIHMLGLYALIGMASNSDKTVKNNLVNYSKLFNKIISNTPLHYNYNLHQIGAQTISEHIDYMYELIRNIGVSGFITAFKDYDDCYPRFNEYLMVNSNINYMPLMMRTGFKYAYLTYTVLNESIQMYDDANGEQHVYKNTIKFNYTKFHLTRSTAVKLMCDVHDELMEANNDDLTEANKAYHAVLDYIVNMINEDMIYDKQPDAKSMIDNSQYPLEFLHETAKYTHLDDIDKRKYFNQFQELCHIIGYGNLLALFKINRDEKGGYHLMKSCTQSFMHKAYPILRKMSKTVNDDDSIPDFLRQDYLRHAHIPNNKVYISRIIDAGFISLTLNSPLDSTNIKNELTACDYIYDNTERFYRFVIMQFIRGFIMKRESDALANRRMPIFNISSIREKHNYDYLNESGVKQFIDTGILPSSLKEPSYPIEYDRNNNIIVKEYEIPSELQDVINNIMPASYAEYHQLNAYDKFRIFEALMEAFMKIAKTNEKYKKAWKKQSRYYNR